jgi:acetolactate decarboxylase
LKLIKNLILFFALVKFFNLASQTSSSFVHVVGEMRNVMWKGQLSGNINLDTITNKTNLYGLGPIEYLTGEILVIDGRSFKSTVATDNEIKVEETFKIKAPFFGYTNVKRWQEINLPAYVRNLKELENYLDSTTKFYHRPTFFKLSGVIDSATIHIVNLPEGSKVSSPEQAHKGLKKYELKNQSVDIIGFFSTEHKAIFTHHDTFLHLHLITANRDKMGHVDELNMIPKMFKLYLPE